MSALDRLEAALDAWMSAPIGGIEEYDAANAMYAAGRAVLTEATPALRRAAA